MTSSLLLAVHDAHEVRNLRDHAARRRRVRQFGHAADLVQAQADQRRALIVLAADRAAGLLDLDLRGHDFASYSLASASPPSRRRACKAETLTLRRAATERGESCRFSASKVARTML